MKRKATQSPDASNDDSTQQPLKRMRIDKGGASSGDSYDMFADDSRTPPPSSHVDSTHNHTENASADPQLPLSFDKSGYLQYRIGHILHNRYKLLELAGTGVFSKVLVAEDLHNTTPNNTVAIKIIRNNESMQRSGYEEIKTLNLLHVNDPKGEYHCLELLDHFDHMGQHVCLVLEKYESNLRQYQFQHGVVPLAKLRPFAYSLLKALYLLKHCELIHADLKPDNILINKEANRVVLGDFGTTLHISEAGISPLLQSRFYRAPEVILGFKHSYAVDMFSLGCTLYEWCAGNILFESRDNNEHLKLIMELKGEVPRKMRHQQNDEGLFAHEYFDERGQFLEHRVDPGDSNRIIVTPSVIQKKHDLFAMLRESCPAGSSGNDLSLLRSFADLLERMLHINPHKRISVEDAFYHEFFQGGS